ncbi:DUF1328 domain-containing protein [Natronocalculus amylovorans]|uniref:UPF0391 membrane protein AArcSt2_03225 n=1 Tax=Natronocalculus amylovorans TaxID=2917812 RepID=A0AAE3FVI4_9EURY|nr:DUF1328 family protein [Natronocalculus amylovorans]MCL9815946.1 DUF1328 domain-containing protein [Natronocalculus amylovorans]
MSVGAAVAFGLMPLQSGFLWYAIVFFVLAIVAAAVGFSGVAGITMEIARIFVLIFLVLAVLSLLL